MTLSDLSALLPLIILVFGIVIIMLVQTVWRNHKLTLILSVLTFVISTAFLTVSFFAESKQVTSLLIFDNYAIFYMAILFGAALAVCFLTYGFMEGRNNIKEEFYIFMLIAALGCGVIVASNHLISFFLGLEVLSVSLYVLIAYLRAGPMDIEAGIKYLVLAAVSVSFLLLGAAFVYAYCGTMKFSAMNFSALTPSIGKSSLLLAGVIMIIIGIGFKLAVVPFHLWTPDVYQGAPAPVTAFIATASKGAVFALLLRYFISTNIFDYRPLFILFIVLSIVTMFFGNLLAIMQNNVKRILAYSSIAHMGYLLAALLAGGRWAIIAVTIYLLTYFITTLGAFGIITILSGKERDFDRLDEYRGLAFRHPVLAIVFSGFLLSLAGIPLTAGFIGKFYIFTANASSGLWILLIAVAINSFIGLYYYLRIIATLYSHIQEPQTVSFESRLMPSFSYAGGLVLILLVFLLVFIGVYPSPFLKIISGIVSSLI